VERLVGQLAARPTGALMTVARSVADVLDDHVTFEVESIDWMYLTRKTPGAVGTSADGSSANGTKPAKPRFTSASRRFAADWTPHAGRPGHHRACSVLSVPIGT
jgi:hypothetical protein